MRRMAHAKTDASTCEAHEKEGRDEPEAIAGARAGLIWCGGLRLTPALPSILFWTLTASAVALGLPSISTAEAKPKKDDSEQGDKKGKGKKGKKGKAGKGSMDESAGEADSGGLAPGSDDAKAKKPERKEPEATTDPAPFMIRYFIPASTDSHWWRWYATRAYEESAISSKNT